MNLAPAIALGGAGFAWHQSTRTAGVTKPVTKAHLGVASGVPMPCDVARVSEEIHGVKTLDFWGQWRVQRASLVARFGTVGAPLLRVPNLDNECVADWCRVWMQQAQARKSGAQLLALKDGILETNTGEAYGNVLRLSRFAAFGDDQVSMRDATKTIERLALAMDSDLHVNTESGLPSNGQLLEESAGDVVKGIGDGLAFGIEALVGPIFGAAVSTTFGVLASAIAPYLLVGGAAYYALKVKA